MREATEHQGPSSGDGPEVWPALMDDFRIEESVVLEAMIREDMKERHEFGKAKYNTPLRADDGQNTLIDAYQEAVDLSVYLYKILMETGSGKYRDMAAIAIDIAANIKIDISNNTGFGE